MKQTTKFPFMEEWRKYKLKDFIEFNPKEKVPQGELCRKISMDQITPFTRFVESNIYEVYKGGAKFRNYDTIMARITPCLENGKTAYISSLHPEEVAVGSTEYIVLRKRENISDSKFIFYLAISPIVRDIAIKSMVGSSGRQRVQQDVLENYEIPIPSLPTQKNIAHILSVLDDKIELNKRINDNLEQQAQALFNEMFPHITEGENMIGDLIMPKRGKGLLSKNAIKGDIPVVAGGIEPATYHNQANTTAPVLTIAASGANAGYINLWYIPVWASDSSYIDDSITPNVYFWYIMLKKRQQEIFDAQVGSAQPHIYPKHIAELPMNVVFVEKIAEYNEIVTPIFEKKGQLFLESKRLRSLRDTLLPKLMSGEVKINETNN